MITYQQQQQTIYGNQYNAENITITQVLARPAGTALQQIFLSAPQEDLGGYRGAVAENLGQVGLTSPAPAWLTHLQAAQHQAKLCESDGFIGMIAHWYGLVPPHHHKSLCHQEFQWAHEHWAQRTPPRLMFFRPEPNSPADVELRQKAEALIGAGDQTHAQQMEHLVQEISSGPDAFRRLKRFSDQDDLVKQVFGTCLMWHQPLTSLAETPALVPPPAARELNPEDLGALGREPHLKWIKRTFRQVSQQPEPAVVWLVSGGPHAGQAEFVQRLLAEELFKRGRPPQKGTLPLHEVTPAQLTEWVGDLLGLTPAGEALTQPAQLAQAVYKALQEQQLCLVLTEVKRVAGGLLGFQQQFWQPFHQALQALCAHHPPPHRLLVVVVVDDTDARETGPSALGSDQTLDCAKLLPLPELTPFSEDDFYDWFEAMEIPEAGQAALAEKLLAQPHPAAVFASLRRETLWPEGA